MSEQKLINFSEQFQKLTNLSLSSQAFGNISHFMNVCETHYTFVTSKWGLKFNLKLELRKYFNYVIADIFTGCKIFHLFFPNWRAMRMLIKTINFGKNLRLSQIQPIKTAEIKFIQF